MIPFDRSPSLAQLERERRAREWLREENAGWPVESPEPVVVPSPRRKDTRKQHGTLAEFDAGCRCFLCADANERLRGVDR